MTMNYKQWKEILGAVNKETDLSKDNVIEKIKEELKKYSEEYKKWEKVGFDIHYLFEVEDGQVTLLHLAAEGGHTEVVKILIANGANVNAKIDAGKVKGVTPLHLAAEGGHTEVVKILIANGANVNAKIDAGKVKGVTPLHLAAEKGHTEVVKILIANGANPLLKNKDGKIPRDLAKDDSIKNLLKEAEEKQLKQQALNKSISAGGATAVLGTAVAVALFVTGTVAVELIPIVIAVAAIAAAALAVGGITYMMLKPSTKVEEVEKEQGLPNEQKIYAGYFM